MTERVVAGFVPLVDCAVLVAARECGFAQAAGIELELVKEPSWASLRDHLTLGHVDCAHALAPLPIASALGVGHVRANCFVPFVLGCGGNAVTVSTRLLEEMQANSSTEQLSTPSGLGAALAGVIRQRSAPLTLGIVFPFSNHNFDLRYWLAAAGVHPDRDVRLVTIPPPLMVESLHAGHVDGFCVGEPWNSLAVEEGIGQIVLTKSQILPRSVEKVLAVRASMEAQPQRLGPLLQGLAAAAAWADDAANRSELAALLARPEYLHVAAGLIEESLHGRLVTGRPSDPDFLYFHRHDANRPRSADALWVYAQMVRWGQLRPHADRQRLAAHMFRGDLYSRHVDVARTPKPEALPALPFDRVEFTTADIDAYLAQFSISTDFVEVSAGLQS